MSTPIKEHIRHILLFEFHKGNTASSATKHSKTLMEMMLWMKRLAEGSFHLQVSKRITSA
ncbi:unnamed protein product [Hymenolepis diminuta]|uniref:Mos1 transposase HTH domain-containing protein n=1 Tax=Hymenolepis diminuta TaxID=6216 RepID=A0A564Y9J1_HYMDI|nr:unnamed protein product [Hymenolepis diminuta]